MAGEIGRFTAIIGGDGSGLTRTLRGSASEVRRFVQQMNREVAQLSTGTEFAGTRVQSLERLRQIETTLQRALQSSNLTLVQRIALEKQLARTTAAIGSATVSWRDALTGTGKNVAGLNAGLVAMGRLFPAIGAAAAGQALLGFASRTIDAADAMKDMAERSGASVGALSVLGQVAEKSGASQETLAVGLRNLAKQVTALRAGSKEAASAFASIGLSASDFVGLSIDQILARVADAQSRFADGAGKTALAMVLFGRSGEELIPTLNALADGGFDKATERAKALGGVMSTDLAKAADDFNDAMVDLRSATGGFGRDLLTRVLPPVTAFITSLTDLRRRAREAETAIPAPFRAIAAEFASFATRGPLFGVVFGSEQAEALRAGSFGDRMKEVVQRLLGVKTAADIARAAVAGLAADPSLVNALATEKRPEVQAPVSRDDEIKALRDLHNAFALTAADLKRAKELEQELRKEIDLGTLSRQQRAQAADDLRTLREVQTPKTDTAPVEALLARVRALVDAYGLAAEEAGRQQGIIPKLVAGHDRIGALILTQRDQESAISNELRTQLNLLKQFDPVIVGLARRQFGSAENLPPVKVPVLGELKDISVPALRDQQRLTISLLGFVTSVTIPEGVAKDAVKRLEQITTLPPLPVEIDPSFDPSAISLEFRRAVESARFAKADLGLAEAIGDQKLFADATNRSTIATAALQKIAQQLANTIRNSPDLTDAQKAFGIEAINNQMGEAARNANNLSDGLRDIVSAGRGLLSSADALGLIGDNARRSIDGVLGLADAFAALQAGNLTGFGKISIAIQIAGAAGQILSDFFDNPGERARNELLRANNEQLDRLRAEISGFGQFIGDQTRTSNVLADPVLLQIARQGGIVPTDLQMQSFERRLEALGLTFADLQAIAERNGIQILDENGRLSAEALIQLSKSTDLVVERLTNFGKSFDDVARRFDARRDIFDLNDDAQTILDDALQVFGQFGGTFFAGLFAGIDTRTKEGRDAIEARVRKLYEDAEKGLIPKEALLGFGSIDEFLQAILGIDHALDRFTETVDRAAGSMINVAEGSFNLNKRLGQILAAPSSTALTRLASTAPSPVPLPATTTSAAASVSIAVDIGGLTIGAAARTKEQVYKELRQQAIDKARTISPQAVAAVQAALPA